MERLFAFVTVASPLHDAQSVTDLLSRHKRRLEALGGQEIRDETEARDLPLLVLVATGGTERPILELLARRQSQGRDDPVWLLAHPTHNALPAALETLARLKQDGVAGRIFYLDADGQGRGWVAVPSISGRRRRTAEFPPWPEPLAPAARIGCVDT